ncbi:MAG TPA: hypothetical protein VKR22_04680 [Acidimicrobiales bacterium]|nr:hypothetical protein [Acidimicrobiales bacterium]
MNPSIETAVIITAISALAEGSDRVVAEEILHTPHGRLEVVLPMPIDEYVRKFSGQESADEFRNLLRQARSVISGPRFDTVVDVEEREDVQYEWAGREVARRCDMLLAVWDGKATRGRGGTAEIVRYSLESAIPVLYIPLDSGEIITDEGRGHLASAFFAQSGFDRNAIETARGAREIPLDRTLRSYARLDRYNKHRRLRFESDHSAVAHTTRERGVPKTRTSEGSPDGSDLGTVTGWIGPFYNWADRRALFFHRWYAAGVLFIYGVAALAVLSASIGWITHSDSAFVAELVLLTLVLGATVLGRLLHLHDHWINSRSLAERLRSAVYLTAAGLGGARDDENGTGDTHRSEDWMSRAFEFVWDFRPLVEVSDLANLRTFLAERWVEPQRRFFQDQAKRYSSRERRLLFASIGLFTATFVVALLHVLDGSSRGSGSSHGTFAETTSILAVSLPAFGSAMAAIAAHLQFHRHASVYADMVRQLGNLNGDLQQATSWHSVRRAAVQIDQVINSEQRDWVGAMRFYDLDLT